MDVAHRKYHYSESGQFWKMPGNVTRIRKIRKKIRHKPQKIGSPNELCAPKFGHSRGQGRRNSRPGPIFRRRANGARSPSTGTYITTVPRGERRRGLYRWRSTGARARPGTLRTLPLEESTRAEGARGSTVVIERARAQGGGVQGGHSSNENGIVRCARRGDAS